MADFLTIAGVPYLVQVQGSPSEHAPDYGGSRERAFAGNLRSTRDTPKRSWSFILGPMPVASLYALQDATSEDAIVAVGGAAIRGAPVDCMVDVEDAGYVENGPQDHQRIARVTILEV